MKKRFIFFSIGIILFLLSLPLSTKMGMELIHNQKMKKQYQITNISQGFPATPSTFKYNDHLVEIKEEEIKDEEYTDPWENKISLGDLAIYIDKVQIDRLKEHPIRIDEEGLNRYYGEIAYLLLEDKNMDQTQFVLLLKKTKEIQKEMPNGDIVGWVPEEKLTYAMYVLDEDGNIDRQTFRLTERSALQTQLVNAGVVAPTRMGYYTNAWEGYPSLFFPLIFPFLTLLIGFTLMLFCFPYRKFTK
ncbi:hypothetical protein ACFYKT_13615 [Cytobacillus sp. FJAT-53684]|uniref:Uncharacterized protein n=1 Tax=Cytobacillus mangrovibacter TaxID=3299024 RepID=A0ABW6JZN4_9BACI